MSAGAEGAWPAPPPRAEGLVARWARRAFALGAVQLAALVALAALVLLPLELALDLARRRPLGLVRAHLMVVVYLWAELGGVCVAAWLWLVPGTRAPDRFREANARLQRGWVLLLLRAATRLFGLRFETEVLTTTGTTSATRASTTTVSTPPPPTPGSTPPTSSPTSSSPSPSSSSSSTTTSSGAPDVRGAPDLGALLAGPVLILSRHVSPVDTLLPIAFLGWPVGPRLRYVMKHELLLDPCIDIVGQRLPNVFVRRGGGARRARDGAASDDGPSPEVQAVGRLAAGLGPADGVLIYPEGTRFTARKREQVLAAVERAGDATALARARELTRVLPARTGGALALLDAAPAADVLLLAHVGLEAAGSFAALADGRLVGRTIRLGLWRVPRAEVPLDRDGRAAWLHAEWSRVDAWVARHEA